MTDSLAGTTVTVSVSPLVKAVLRGEFPPVEFLPDGCNADAWQKVRACLEDHPRLAWKIFLELRQGMQRLEKAKSKASLPKSKRKAELHRIFDALMREIEALHTLADSVPDEMRRHCAASASHCTAALKPLVEIFKLDINKKRDMSERYTVDARHAFFNKIDDILKAGMPGYDLMKEADFSLLRNICLTAGIIKRASDFPENFRKKLADKS